jgi:hypothetical protein
MVLLAASTRSRAVLARNQYAGGAASMMWIDYVNADHGFYIAPTIPIFACRGSRQAATSQHGEPTILSGVSPLFPCGRHH